MLPFCMLPFAFLQGGFKVTPAGYAHMIHALSALADGKVVIALEVESSIWTLTQEKLLDSQPWFLFDDPRLVEEKSQVDGY